MPKCICNTTKSQLRSKLSKIFHLLASNVLLLFVILYMTDIVCQHGGKWLVSAAVDGSYGFDSIGMLNVCCLLTLHLGVALCPLFLYVQLLLNIEPILIKLNTFVVYKSRMCIEEDILEWSKVDIFVCDTGYPL